MQINQQVLESAVIQKSVTFLKKSFKKNPHYSFNDWTIMVDHSISTMKIALQLTENYPKVDKVVIALAALFHDIGKTIKADEQTLYEKHEELGRDVTKDFLQTLDLTTKQIQHIQELFQKNHPSLEKRITKDADYVDFYMNERLQNAFKKWVDEKNLSKEIERKFVRFEKMTSHAKLLATPYRDALKEKWQFA